MNSNNPSINATELLHRITNNEEVNLLDVREEIEFCTYNIGGQNIALNKLMRSLNSVKYKTTEEIVVLCKVGKRSKTAQSILKENGYQNVRNLEGGLMALQKLK